MQEVKKNGLPIAMGTKVSVTLRGNKYTVGIRGWLENQYVITDNPYLHGEMVRIAPQTGCAVNYVLDGTFINFKTVVTYTYSQIISLMILDFPKSFETYSLRKFTRLKSHFSINYSTGADSDGNFENGTVRDLSLSGTLISHRSPLAKGARVKISIPLVEGSLTDLNAVVRNIRKHPRNVGEPYITGLEFDKLSDEEEKILRKFIENRVTDRRSVERT